MSPSARPANNSPHEFQGEIMGFFDTLRRVLGGVPGTASPAPEDVPTDWGLMEGKPTPAAEPVGGASAYDRANWQNKLKRVLDGLPDTEGEWPELMAEAKALGLDTAWVTRAQVEEFMLLIRRAVSDRHFTEEEHRKLDLARDLIGIPEAEAEAALHSVVAEAEKFFGKSVDGA
jgi:hypothetical protein